METINDIVAEMRSYAKRCREENFCVPPAIERHYHEDDVEDLADRIEAAWKRESEAGAEAAQICGEIGEIVGREATTEKSSAVGNANAVRGIAQEMLNTSMQDIRAEAVYGWATRLAAACEQPVTDCDQLGNTAAMRKALEKVRFYLPYLLQYVRLHDAQSGGYYEKKLEVVNAALSAPPRNCDVGTAEEQYKHFLKFCHGANCSKCPVHDAINCKFAWANMPYEEGGEK